MSASGIGDEALFTLRDVRFKHVLDIEHLTLPAGKITFIIGRSGSGKSTLLRLLNRMISPDEGTIRFRSESLDEINPVELRRRVVMLPQNPIIFSGTIRENVLKGLEFSEKPPIDDSEIVRLLDLMQISKSLDGRASTLSGGERQRVAIARVLAMKPEVMLLDEPTSALDSDTQTSVIEQIVTGVRRYGVEMISVTHARDIAEQCGEYLVEMEAGKVLRTQEGRTI